MRGRVAGGKRVWTCLGPTRRLFVPARAACPVRMSAGPTRCLLPLRQRCLFVPVHHPCVPPCLALVRLRWPAYVPRDDLDVTKSLLDWNGDHPYTNYRSMFTTLRSLGYYVDVLGASWTTVDLSRSGEGGKVGAGRG